MVQKIYGIFYKGNLKSQAYGFGSSTNSRAQKKNQHYKVKWKENQESPFKWHLASASVFQSLFKRLQSVLDGRAKWAVGGGGWVMFWHQKVSMCLAGGLQSLRIESATRLATRGSPNFAQFCVRRGRVMMPSAQKRGLLTHPQCVTVCYSVCVCSVGAVKFFERGWRLQMGVCVSKHVIEEPKDVGVAAHRSRPCSPCRRRRRRRLFAMRPIKSTLGMTRRENKGKYNYKYL